MERLTQMQLETPIPNNLTEVAVPTSIRGKASEDHASCRLRVVNPNGLHLRAAAEIVKVVRRFSAEITFEHKGVRADARSILSIACLAVAGGSQVSASAIGADAAPALEALARLFARGFADADRPAEERVSGGRG